MRYLLDNQSDDCYEGTTCLINKLEIKDEEKLQSIETIFSYTKAAELYKSEYNGKLDFEYYKAIHKYLFEDIYFWAGEIRKVDISKKGTYFCEAKELEKSCESAFNSLIFDNYYCNESQQSYIEKIADFYILTNFLHPFREGNGRTQRIFFTQLIKRAGHEFSFSSIDSDELMIATIQAAGGVKDNLISLFRDNIIF